MTDCLTPAAKRRRYTSNIITVKVGAQAEILTVHESDIKEHSPFFKASLDAKWREGKTREISLPEDDADVVATYFDWLTTKDVPLFTKIEPSFVRPLPHYALLSKLYTFGEKVQSDAFCDDVLSKICQGLEQVHHDNGEVSTFAFLDKIRFAYEGTPASSPLRRLLVEGFAKGGSVESLDGEHGNPGPEFMMDLAKALLAARDAKEYSWDKNRKKFFKKKPVSSQDLANSLPADTSERTRKRKSGRD